MMTNRGGFLSLLGLEVQTGSQSMYSENGPSDTLQWGPGWRFFSQGGSGIRLRESCEDSEKGVVCSVFRNKSTGFQAQSRPRMTELPKANRVGIAIIGAGAVSDYHHVPGINIDPRARLVAVCDASAELLERRKSDWGVDNVTDDYEKVCAVCV